MKEGPVCRKTQDGRGGLPGHSAGRLSVFATFASTRLLNLNPNLVPRLRFPAVHRDEAVTAAGIEGPQRAGSVRLRNHVGYPVVRVHQVFSLLGLVGLGYAVLEGGEP